MNENEVFEVEHLDMLPLQRERIPVGALKFHATGETVEYYSEKELMEDYLEEVQYLGYSGVSYELYLTPQEINELAIPNEEELLANNMVQNDYIQKFQEQNKNVADEEREL